MTLDEQKAAARKAAFARRRAAHAAGQDALACDHLDAVLSETGGGALAGYMPIRTEISPLAVMSAWTGRVGVPVIQGAGERLLFRAWSETCEMVEGPFGAAIPASGQEFDPDILIVPLVAFGPGGQRLGYGGGFYDRTLEYLRAQKPITAIGFAYDAQMATDLPQEATDQPLDMIVTEAGVKRL